MGRRKVKVDQLKQEYRKYFNNEEFVEAWTEWRDVCARKGSVDTLRSWNRHLKDAVFHGRGNILLMIKIIDQSADGGSSGGAWTKLYAWKPDDSEIQRKTNIHPELS